MVISSFIVKAIKLVLYGPRKIIDRFTTIKSLIYRGYCKYIEEKSLASKKGLYYSYEAQSLFSESRNIYRNSYLFTYYMTKVACWSLESKCTYLFMPNVAAHFIITLPKYILLPQVQVAWNSIASKRRGTRKSYFDRLA